MVRDVLERVKCRIWGGALLPSPIVTSYTGASIHTTGIQSCNYSRNTLAVHVLGEKVAFALSDKGALCEAAPWKRRPIASAY